MVGLPYSLSSELGAALRRSRGALIGIGVFSVLTNILTLTGSFYMLQVYDRVIPSRSIPTLLGLSILAAMLYVGQGLLDFVRSRVLLRVGRALDEDLSQRVFSIVTCLPLLGKSSNDGLQPLRDLDQVRGFFASSGPLAFFDLPWLPVYLSICFIFHPLIGAAALSGAILMAFVTALADALTRRPMQAAALHGAGRLSLAEASRRNAEVLTAMGMTGHLGTLWGELNRKHLDAHERASDVSGGLGGFTRVFRMALQSGVLGLGAYLVIQGKATGGIIIASSILTARALSPVELAIANWKGFVAARQSWRRLKDLLAAVPLKERNLPLRKPSSTLAVEAAVIVPPGDQKIVVKGLSFRLEKGCALGIIGPSGSGKSCLARALVGVWKPVRGSVRLDAATLDQWSPEALGRHVGYLPQDIELFDGTVGQNIARFDPEADPEAIISAAETAGVHDMIVQLQNGYDTRIGDGGTALSAGQRQRVALARALYGNPFLIVLDEPNSNLDAEGEAALSDAIKSVRDRGGIAIVIAHRSSVLAAVDFVLVMRDGEGQLFGPRDEVLRKVVRPVPPKQLPAAAAGAA
ncbi:type I secretion system permease/ATPase [Microvirga sp. TS319]|uniref:type I secretion system permease/ATPase n=1 Tax=Microvirga sp. TS319 TaxID=3241165 RepID=UPI00351A90CF